MNPNKSLAKDFLKQVAYIDQRINSKLEQAISLRELATKATTTISDMPINQSGDDHRMEAAICKMMDLESEINSDIDKLLDVKRQVMDVIRRVERPEYQSLLEMKYLCLKTWEEVAEQMGYAYRQVTRMHGHALELVEAVLLSRNNDEQ